MPTPSTLDLGRWRSQASLKVLHLTLSTISESSFSSDNHPTVKPGINMKFLAMIVIIWPGTRLLSFLEPSTCFKGSKFIEHSVAFLHIGPEQAEWKSLSESRSLLKPTMNRYESYLGSQAYILTYFSNAVFKPLASSHLTTTTTIILLLCVMLGTVQFWHFPCVLWLI